MGDIVIVLTPIIVIVGLWLGYSGKVSIGMFWYKREKKSLYRLKLSD